ncbi:hypothetical protein E4K10_49955 [Streptomyces sp. T1317-0309]|nr:hypothetical protein E4K10_49955 [Streptomyces sp. T1317-0309]
MADEIFDPEIHATDKDGNPSMNKDGSFRKKRKDAGNRGSRTASAPKASTPSGAAGAAHERYRRNVEQFPASASRSPP